MTSKKKKSIAAQARERLEQEGLALARGIREPGQSKADTRAIARGIQKGIALYKAQEKSRARERDKERKRRQRAVSSGEPGTDSAEVPSGGVGILRTLAGLGLVVTGALLIVVIADSLAFARWDGTRPGLLGTRGLVYRGMLLDTHLECASGMLHLEIAGLDLGARAPRDAMRASAICTRSVGQDARRGDSPGKDNAGGLNDDE